MIYNDRQYRVTLTVLAKLQEALAALPPVNGTDGWVLQAQTNGLQSQIADLQAEIDAYRRTSMGRNTLMGLEMADYWSPSKGQQTAGADGTTRRMMNRIMELEAINDDLLKAMEGLLDWFSDPVGLDDKAAVSKARAAIAKARGEA